MSERPSPPDPVEDDPEAGPRRPLLGLRFWLLIGFAALCIVAGLVVARLGPVWFPVA